MLVRNDKKQHLARLHAARVNRSRKRKKNGIIHLRGDVDCVFVECFLEDAGTKFLTSGVEHSHDDIEKAFWKYIHFMLNSKA
jgi:hypothetical protein